MKENNKICGNHIIELCFTEEHSKLKLIQKLNAEFNIYFKLYNAN